MVPCSVPRSTRIARYHKKHTKHYHDGLFLVQGVPERPITIKKIPNITVMACFCAKEYQEGQLPPKKYQALPWWLVSVPRSTRKASYHTKYTKHYHDGLFLVQGVPERPITKNTKHYRDGLFLCQGVPGRPVTIQKKSIITVIPCFCIKEYQEGRLPSEKYQALP